MPADFEIDTSEVLALARRYEDGPRIAQSELLSAMGGAVKDTQANVRAVIEPFSRTNKLANTLAVQTRQTGRSVEWSVRATQPYAQWVDDGRGPVYPKRAKVLHWITRGGASVFARRAKAFAGHHFTDKGLQRSLGQIERRFEQAAERIAARLVGR